MIKDYSDIIDLERPVSRFRKCLGRQGRRNLHRLLL